MKKRKWHKLYMMARGGMVVIGVLDGRPHKELRDNDGKQIEDFFNIYVIKEIRGIKIK